MTVFAIAAGTTIAALFLLRKKIGTALDNALDRWISE